MFRNSPVCFLLLICALVLSAFALENGVARTPPMGFNPYNAGYCGMREIQWKTIAYAMSVNGMKDAGYIYCNTDCGINSANVRDAQGNYTWSRSMFPNGIPALWEYIHSLGLKAGLYIFPPHQDHQIRGNIEKDATTFASWGCDYLKYDGWAATEEWQYAAMRDALNATGRPIVYSANIIVGPRDGTICNMWRTSADIDNTWESVIGSISSNAYGRGKPGAWPDPDMMQVGNLGNDEMDKTHFSLWCVSSSPLISGHDPRQMFLHSHYVLLNTEAIAVNQDTAFSTNASYGGSGKRVRQGNGQEVWLKTVTGGAKAVVLVNTGTSSASVSVTWSEIGLPPGTAQVRDLWEHKNIGPFTDRYTAQLPPRGCAFLKIVEGTNPIPEPPATWFPKPELRPLNPLPRTGWRATTNVTNVYSSAPADALDGNLQTVWRTSPTNNDGDWIAVDMQMPQTFNCVVTTSPKDNVGSFIKPYRVYTSSQLWRLYTSQNGTTWEGPVDTIWSGPHDYKIFALKQPITARHIRIVRTFHGAVDSKDRTAFGFMNTGIGELYVAHVSNLPLQAHWASKPPLMTESQIARWVPQRSVLLAPARGATPPSLFNGALTNWYNVTGRAIGSGSRTKSANAAPGVLIADPRKEKK